LLDHITLFIICVTVVIAVSLLVYIFGLKNKGGRCSTAWAVPAPVRTR
jgi:MFS transporter, MHS family, alpha-ketoglutarate permease